MEYQIFFLMCNEDLIQIKKDFIKEYNKYDIENEKIFVECFNGKDFMCNPKYIVVGMLKNLLMLILFGQKRVRRN